MTDVAMALAKYVSSDESAEFSWAKMQSEGAGNNFFVQGWPDSPDDAGQLSRYGGGGPDATFNKPFQVRNPRVQLMVRSKDIVKAFDRAEAIMKKLGAIVDQTINGVNFQKVTPVGEPTDLGPDSGGRERVVVNFDIGFYD